MPGEEPLFTRLARLARMVAAERGGLSRAQEIEVWHGLRDAALALTPSSDEPAVLPPPKRGEHWLTTLCVLVLFAGAVWLVAVIAITGAAFVVSWAGGDVVGWLIGFPACAMLVAFVVGVITEVFFGRKRGRRDA